MNIVSVIFYIINNIISEKIFLILHSFLFIRFELKVMFVFDYM